MKRLPLSLLSVSLALVPLVNAAELEPRSFRSGEWIETDHPLRLQIQEGETPIAGRLVFFIGTQDATALMRQTGINEYTYAADVLPLTSGSQQIKLYAVDQDNQWQSVAELTINVLTKTGLEVAEVTTRFDVTESSQFKQEARGDAFAADPETYDNMAMSTGLTTQHKRGSWEARSNWNIVSTSVQAEALRFGQLQNDAPKTDLSSYLFEVEKGNGKLAIGHVNFGNNSLLINGLANRGIVGNYRAFDRLDFSVTSQSGQAITGYNNFFGTSNYSSNSIQAAALGFDFLRGGAQLRAELSYLTAEVTSDLNFNVGEVADSERSSGLGLTITGQSTGGRLRGNAVFAKSRYTNPFDPFLAQGFTLVDAQASTDNARTIKLDYDWLRPDPNTGTGSTLTMTLQHERTDLLYKSIGAFVTPDVEANTLSLTGLIGQISWQLQAKHSRDNLEDLNSVLTTVTESKSLTISIPLQSGANEPNLWLPQNLGLSSQHLHQYGDNLPIGFDPNSHVPDQVNVLHSLNVAWQIGSQSIGYNVNWSDQDNRQPGRAQADFRDVNHGLNLNLTLSQQFRLGLNFGAVIASDIEQSLKRYTDSASVSIDWRIGDKVSITGNYGLTRGRDSEDFAESDNYTTQTQVTYTFELALFGARKLPGQLYLRHALNSNYSLNNQFQFESEGRSWSLNGGFNISMF